MENLQNEILRLNLKSIIQTKEKLKDHIIETPTIKFNSSFLKKINPNTEIFMKLELFQHTGTFKARGALSAASQINKNKRKFGITAASAGNHAIAASWAAKKLEMSAKVVMRSTANPYRLKQVKNEDAEIIITDNLDELFKIAKKLVDEEKRTFIHPFEGLSTSLGTAAIGLEFIKSVPSLDAVIVSIGGGGLISGVSAAIKQVNEKCKIFGVEPKGAATMLKSFSIGNPIQNVIIDSEVDSLSPPMTLPFSYAVCKKYSDEIVTVSDEEIFASMVFCKRKVS